MRFTLLLFGIFIMFYMCSCSVGIEYETVLENKTLDTLSVEVVRSAYKENPVDADDFYDHTKKVREIFRLPPNNSSDLRTRFQVGYLGSRGFLDLVTPSQIPFDYDTVVIRKINRESIVITKNSLQNFISSNTGHRSSCGDCLPTKIYKIEIY